MFWLKPLEVFSGRQSVFSISPKGIWCEIRDNLLTCGGSQTQYMMCHTNTIEIDLSKVPLHQWSHVTFSSSQDGGSYLQIEDTHEVIAYKESDQIPFSQTTFFWDACIGKCHSSDMGIKAGIRELVLFGESISSEIASKIKNQNLGWPQNTILYYRFNDANFFDDQVWPNQAQVIGAKSQSDVKASELLIQDICPISGDVKNFYMIGNDYKSSFEPLRLGKRWNFDVDQQDYHYSMQMEIYPTHHWCHMQDALKARESCSIWHMREVMLLYKTAPDRARFFFFAKNVFEETQSSEFELPQNQWINIQVSLSKTGGYEIKTFDVFGRQKFHEYVQKTMPEQQPQKTMDLFQNFRGYASHFTLCKESKILPFAKNEHSGCELFYTFNDEHKSNDKSSIRNQKDTQESLDLVWNKPSQTKKHFYTNIQSQGDFLRYDSISFAVDFDGLTCSDKHRVFKTKSIEAMINANTDFGLFKSNIPGLRVEDQRAYSAVTVEFWAKFEEIQANRSILQMANIGLYNEQIGNSQFMVIDTNEQGQIRCRPFGDDAPELEVIYTDIQQVDRSGWFHFICKFQGGDKIEASLFNTKIDQRYIQDTQNSSKMFPGGKYKVRVGHSFGTQKSMEGLEIKEVKVWNEFRDNSLLEKYRYNQLDMDGLHMDLSSLQVYLMMARDDYLIENLASLNNQYISKAVSFSGFEYSPGEGYTHVVCPANTYFDGNDCLANPLKHFEILTSTKLNEITQELDWIIEVKPFSYIANNPEFEFIWEFNNPVLNFLAVQNSQNQTFPQRALVMESQVNMTVSILQDEFRIDEVLQFIWIPNDCKQMQIETALDRVVETFDEDIKMVYKLKEEGSCLPSSFYDKLKEARVSYQVDEDQNTFDEIPQIETSYSDDGSVVFTIPKTEQIKFPFHKNISFMFSFYWTNAELQDQDMIDYESVIFQNTYHVLKFSPAADFIIPKLKSSFDGLALTNENILFDGSDTKIVFAEQRGLEHFWPFFTWTCSPPFADYCESFTIQNVTKFDFPFTIFEEYGGEYETNYTVTLNLIQDDGAGNQKTFTKETVFSYNELVVSQMKIRIPDPNVLVSADIDQFIDLDEDPSILEKFTINWKSLPLIGKQIGEKLQIPKLTLMEQQKYDVTVELNHKEFIRVDLNKTKPVYTGYAPRNGIIQLEPPSGQLGLSYIVSIMYWDYEGPSLQWRFWSTTDLGEKETLVTEWLDKDSTFEFVAESVNPLHFEFRDNQGEVSQHKFATSFTAPQIQPLMLRSILGSDSTQKQTKYAYMKSNEMDAETFKQSLDQIKLDISSERLMLELQISTLNEILKDRSYSYNMDEIILRIRDVSGEYLQDFVFLDSVAQLLGKAQISAKVLNDYSDEILTQMCGLVWVQNVPTTISHQDIKFIIEKIASPSEEKRVYHSVFINTEEIFQGSKQRPFCLRTLVKSMPGSYDIIRHSIIDADLQPVTELDPFSAIQAKFSPRKSTFVSNQTVCMNYIQDTWNGDYCQTSYEVDMELISCSCKYPLITVMNDQSRTQGMIVWENEDLNAGIQSLEYFLMVVFYLIAQMSIFKQQIKENRQVMPMMDAYQTFLLRVQMEFNNLQTSGNIIHVTRQELEESSFQGFPASRSMIKSLHFVLGPFMRYYGKPVQSQYMKLMELTFIYSILRIYLFFSFESRDEVRASESALDQDDLLQMVYVCAVGLLIFQPWISLLMNFEKQGFRYFFTIVTNITFVATVIGVSFSQSSSIDKYCQWVCIAVVTLISIFILDPARIFFIYHLTILFMHFNITFNQVARDNIERHRLLKIAYDKVNDGQLHLLKQIPEEPHQASKEPSQLPDLYQDQEPVNIENISFENVINTEQGLKESVSSGRGFKESVASQRDLNKK